MSRNVSTRAEAVEGYDYAFSFYQQRLSRCGKKSLEAKEVIRPHPLTPRSPEAPQKDDHLSACITDREQSMKSVD